MAQPVLRAGIAILAMSDVPSVHAAMRLKVDSGEPVAGPAGQRSDRMHAQHGSVALGWCLLELCHRENV